MTQNIEDILRDEEIGTTITCGKAHMIAEKYQIPLTEIGSWCIKTTSRYLTACLAASNNFPDPHRLHTCRRIQRRILDQIAAVCIHVM